MSGRPEAGPAARAVRRIRASGGIVLAALAAGIALAPSWAPRLQSAGFDAYQVLAPRRVESMPAVVVAIDEKSLAALGQWPWPRNTLARLVREIARRDPAAIGLDLLLPEPDRLSPERLLERDALADAALAARLAALPSHDGDLANALASAPTVLGIAGAPEPTRMALRAPPFAIHDAHGAPAIPAAIARFPAVVASIEVLDRAARGHGLLSAGASSEVIRRIPLVADVDGTLVPAFVVELVRVALGAPALRLLTDAGAVRGVAVRDFLASTEDDGAVRPYYSPRDGRRFVSALDVLEGRVDPERLRGKFVLIGTTGLGLVDYQNTPLGIRMPGSEIQAQLLENLFDGTLLARPRFAGALEVALFVAAGSLLILATPVWQPRSAALLAIGAMALPLLIGFAAFRAQRWLFDAVTPALGLAVLFAALLVLTLGEANRRRKALERQVQRQRERAARAAGELAAAQRIQTGMLPRADLLRGDCRVDLAAAMIPAREVGGDLYDYFMLDGRRLFLLIGDVAGKGLSASIFMAISKALYKSATLRMTHADIGALMSAANTEVSRDNPETLFVTTFASILDLDTGELAYCNAGSENPYLLRADSPALGRLSDGDGPPLCAVDDFRYRGGAHRMRPGELMVLVTDGVTEARNRAGELYGGARLQAVLAGLAGRGPTAQAVVDALRASVGAFAEGTEPADDLTLLAVRWNGPAANAGTPADH